ncbi:unnamed protein product [Amoebophrya sp. A25]|nr:unnamed protein product [Amoebophrya sp. A25]|eukprot:GSA25T00023545001.1
MVGLGETLRDAQYKIKDNIRMEVRNLAITYEVPTPKNCSILQEVEENNFYVVTLRNLELFNIDPNTGGRKLHSRQEKGGADLLVKQVGLTDLTVWRFSNHERCAHYRDKVWRQRNRLVEEVDRLAAKQRQSAQQLQDFLVREEAMKHNPTAAAGAPQQQGQVTAARPLGLLARKDVLESTVRADAAAEQKAKQKVFELDRYTQGSSDLQGENLLEPAAFALWLEHATGTTNATYYASGVIEQISGTLDMAATREHQLLTAFVRQHRRTQEKHFRLVQGLRSPLSVSLRASRTSLRVSEIKPSETMILS